MFPVYSERGIWIHLHHLFLLDAAPVVSPLRVSALLRNARHLHFCRREFGV
jgi:hypothetical protein